MKPNRTWFQFRLRTLLLLPVLAVLGWWWVTWPERTARRFLERLEDRDFQAAAKMVDSDTEHSRHAFRLFREWSESCDSRSKWSKFELRRPFGRSLVGSIIGRGNFRVVLRVQYVLPGPEGLPMGQGIMVKRGRIVMKGLPTTLFSALMPPDLR